MILWIVTLLWLVGLTGLVFAQGNKLWDVRRNLKILMGRSTLSAPPPSGPSPICTSCGGKWSKWEVDGKLRRSEIVGGYGGNRVKEYEDIYQTRTCEECGYLERRRAA